MNENIFRKASDIFGPVAQMIVAVEECAELQQALIKTIRTGKASDNLAEEIADVLIMIDQIRLLFPNMDIETWLKSKIDRFEKKLEMASND